MLKAEPLEPTVDLGGNSPKSAAGAFSVGLKLSGGSASVADEELPEHVKLPLHPNHPQALSTTDHVTILYFKCMLAVDAIIYHVRVGLPPPDTCWKRTSIDMEKESTRSSTYRLPNGSSGKNPPPMVLRNCIVNPLLVGSGLDHHLFQIFPS